MPRKDFQGHLAQASVPGIFPRLSDIGPGDDDGSILFTYTAPLSNKRVDIQATVSGMKISP